MIENHKLLIDKNCPMCNIYGKTFKKFNMLDQESITPYQMVGESLTSHIDMHRAQNEVALHNTLTGKTIYGLDSMIEIFSQRKKWIKKPLQFPIIYLPLMQLYKFITYNRKVIAGNIKSPLTDRQCEPDFNYFYRTLFILFSAIFTGLILHRYNNHITSHLGFTTPWFLEYLISFGQIAWQMVMIVFWSRSHSWDYLGNMSAVSTLGALLLLPLLFINTYVDVHGLFFLAYFILIISIMLWEHLRRCKNLEIGYLPTISWLGFRFFVLAIILMFI